MGKRKIEMRRIEKESARQVCFSKRRQGLFKKAKELSTLCGVDIAFLVFSPAGRFYSFANTDIESILHRYCKENNDQSPASTTTTTSNGEEGGHDNFWWEKVNVEEMEEENDLQQLQKSLQEVRGKVVSRLEELSSASSLLSLVALPSSLDLITTTSAAAAAAAVVTWPPPLDHLLPPCSVGDESAANAMNTTHVELEASPLPQPHDGDSVMQVKESLFLDFALDEDDDGLLMPVFGEGYDDGLLMKPVLEEEDGLSGPMDDMFAPLDDYGNLFGSFES